MAKLANDNNQTHTIKSQFAIHSTMKLTSTQVVETSVIVNNKSSFQNYTNQNHHTQYTFFLLIFTAFYILIHSQKLPTL